MDVADALAGAVVCITGTLSMSRKDMTAKLQVRSPPSAAALDLTPPPIADWCVACQPRTQGAGATVGAGVTGKTTHVLSTPAEVQSKTNKIIMVTFLSPAISPCAMRDPHNCQARAEADFLGRRPRAKGCRLSPRHGSTARSPPAAWLTSARTCSPAAAAAVAVRLRPRSLQPARPL